MNYVLDQRKSRIKSLRLQREFKSESRFFNYLLDVGVLMSSILLMMAFVKSSLDIVRLLVSMYNLESLFGNAETLSIKVAVACSIITYVLAVANYKQIAYVAKAVMMITIMVIIYITFYVFYKFLMQQNLFKDTNSLHQLQSNTTHISDHTPSPESDLKINWILPFNPYFINEVTQSTGIYEGIPLIPALFSNARNQDSFESTIKSVIITYSVYVQLFSPLCVATFGHKLREIVLLNLQYGEVSCFILLNYGIVMLFGSAMMFRPAVDIIANFRQNYLEQGEGK